jgi:signal transduction histidine kinase
MVDRLWGDPAGKAQPNGHTNGHGAASPLHLKQSANESPARGGPIRRVMRVLIDYLPRGNTLDAETFRRRHLLMCWILALHIPALWAFGVWRGYGVAHSALEVVVPTACLVFARLARNRRLAAFFVTAGLVFCSSVLVHLSGGMIEAHFHFFILIGLIALYQDWVPFLWNVVFTVLSHGIGSTIGANLMFNHGAAQTHPWTWSVIHGVAVLAACVGVIIFWKNTELEQRRSTRLAAELAESEIASAQAQAAQRRSISELYVNLARRNQSLLDRQLALISELEQQENKPQALADLFQLDHLATRIRRNAESLLVLSGDEPPRLWGRPVPLAEVVRAAAAEVEDYPRVQVLVSDHLEVTGRVVADLSHLLAELIENATMFSPPASEVRVRTHLVPGERPTFLLSIEDIGIGMSDEHMQAANELLADPPDVDPRRSTLGFHVVARLAQRLGLQVSLAHTPGGGVTALVVLSSDVVSERRVPVAEIMPPALVGGGAFGSVGPDRSAWTVHDHGLARRALAPVAAVAPVAWPATPGAPPIGAPDPFPAPPPFATPEPYSTPQPYATPQPYVAPEPFSAPAFAAPERHATPEPLAVPPPVTPDVTADGLVRRVPGASLAPSLRKTSVPDAAVPTAAGGTTPADWHRSEQAGSMLSRFQASQRAGRAAAAAAIDAETGSAEDVP